MGSTVRLSDIVCDGYEEYWRSHKFYRVIKGSKGSGKSKTAALWHIFHMMKYPKSNTLVVRKVYGTLRDSTYTDLLWAIDRLGVTKYWDYSVNPLKITFKREPDKKETWQEIHFRGLDDAQKIASIAVRNGWLNWVWFEEASQITNYEEFEKVVMSIRGYIPPETGLWKSVTITFNPWSDKHWLKARFFDEPHRNVLAMTTTYRCNRWLGPEDLERYHDMEEHNPRLARIICDGDWGVSEGLVYEDWEAKDFDILHVAETHPNIKFSFGLDFGFSISYNAFVAVAIDMDSRTIWVFDEMYGRGIPNFEIAKRITEMGYQDEIIIADSASPKDIFDLQKGFKEMLVDEDGLMIPGPDGQPQYNYYVLPNIRSALKGGDSLKNGIQRIQSFHLVVNATKCPNTITELSQYCYDTDKDGNFLDRPIKEYDHCLVAGTMVLTDHGEIPIEDVKVGDKVLTHLGYREVLASGITRPEPAEIWRVTFEDGTYIEGTEDHPFTTNRGIVYLKDLKGLYVVKNGHTTDQRVQDNSAVYNHEHDPLRRLLNLRRNNTSLRRYVHDSIWADDKGWVQAISVEKTARFEFVYDLTVDEAHTFFANNILVLNCMDALRYSTECIFTNGSGRVIEAGVYQPVEVMQPTKHKCKRVFSTYD